MRIVSRLLRKLGACFRTPPPVSFEEKRLQPVSRLFGFDRGTPLDRYYIEKFLQEHSSCITGDVLEVADDGYTRKFGHDAVPHVLHVDSSSRKATITGDLSKPETLPEEIADCFVCTQTFNFIYGLDDAVLGAHKLLRPGGVLLATVSGISQVSRYDMDRWGDYWRFTVLSAERLFSGHFREVAVKGYGNVFVAKAFLDGLSVEDVNDTSLLDFYDEDYTITIGVFARK